MTPKLERLACALILAPLAPLTGLMLGWWAAYSLLPEKWIPLVTLAVFGLGILMDCLWLRKLLDSAHQFHVLTWIAIFLFYSVGLFGFFMGVPVFNALLAIPAGFVAASRLARRKAAVDEVSRHSQRVAWFTTAVLLLVCIASAVLALICPSTPSDLRGMLGLGFEVTWAMVAALIVVGGLGLLVFNWVLTFSSSSLLFKLFRQSP